MQKVWNLVDIDEEKVKRVAKKNNISTMLARLILARNVVEDDVSTFLNFDLKNIKDPYLIKDM